MKVNFNGNRVTMSAEDNVHDPLVLRRFADLKGPVLMMVLGTTGKLEEDYPSKVELELEYLEVMKMEDKAA